MYSLRFIYLCLFIMCLCVICLDPICVFDMIYMLTAIGLTPGGSSTVHIDTQTIHRTTPLTTFGWKAFWDSNPELSD